MVPEALIHGVGSVGPFQSRVFLPAFATALMLRFAPELGLDDFGLLEAVVGMDGDQITKQLSWFTGNASLMILGVLSLLEVAATKSPEAREMLDYTEAYIKPAMAVVAYMGVVDTVEAQKIAEVVNDLPQAAGLLDWFPAFCIGAATYVVVTLRQGATEGIREADPDDDTGIRGLVSWANDIWAFFGIWLLILVPVLIISITAILVLLFYWLKRRAMKKDEQSKVACSKCDEPVYNCALACGHCGEDFATPHKIGFFGQSLKAVADDRTDHPYRLAEKSRCPVCATRLKERNPKQTCPTCQHKLMHDPAFAARYCQRITARLPLVLIVCAGLSLIPIVGLIPGVIVYRVALVGPFRRYVPRVSNMLTRWGIRILFVLLAVLQIMPGINVVVVPIMAMVNYAAYRGQFQRMLDKTPPPDGGAVVPGAAATAG